MLLATIGDRHQRRQYHLRVVEVDGDLPRSAHRQPAGQVTDAGDDKGVDCRRRIHETETTTMVRFGGKDRKSTRLNSSHVKISYAVFCLKKKKQRRKRQAHG